ncbi:MAG: hypothetical protein Ct9H300mP28_15000 [Pseudomonadota bacterium]|nr:MAG: hypothetical protein Ct9H300mP28_15000 [Pseudomonadota bacterium]
MSRESIPIMPALTLVRVYFLQKNKWLKVLHQSSSISSCLRKGNLGWFSIIASASKMGILNIRRCQIYCCQTRLKLRRHNALFCTII